MLSIVISDYQCRANRTSVKLFHPLGKFEAEWVFYPFILKQRKRTLSRLEGNNFSLTLEGSQLHPPFQRRVYSHVFFLCGANKMEWTQSCRIRQKEQGSRQIRFSLILAKYGELAWLLLFKIASVL